MTQTSMTKAKRAYACQAMFARCDPTGHAHFFLPSDSLPRASPNGLSPRSERCHDNKLHLPSVDSTGKKRVSPDLPQDSEAFLNRSRSLRFPRLAEPHRTPAKKNKPDKLPWNTHKREALLDALFEVVSDPKKIPGSIRWKDVLRIWKEELQPSTDEKAKQRDAAIDKPEFYDKCKAILAADPQNASTPPISTSVDSASQIGLDDGSASAIYEVKDRYETEPSSASPTPSASTQMLLSPRLALPDFSLLPNTLYSVQCNSAENPEAIQASLKPDDENAHLLLELERRDARMKMQIEAQERQIEAQQAKIDDQKAQIDAQKTRITSLEESLELWSQDKLAMTSGMFLVLD
ncbi:hypothetical protein BDK51DRAFT_45708 [Blyttiomyces helicus]|uniref:Uncharacterized protein n=1 Tax=Blyttiomyces helicus TaxID=388810 RepID=A0A4P9W129_9FUNG|nr:hypothetical protein BDK51DRAFT_45708 [Blyttiomyces helicus]|eukprot:RKO84843.1 hypothetical protein BDK51DRAFT_45708 [Blyttiomyces helicus]